jgi:transcriptional regulator with XRE-family HTH domain
MKTKVSQGNRVRQARRHAKLTQQELAARVGVHRSPVAQWEREFGSHPTAENLARIAMATAVHFEWLATGRGRMKHVSNLTPEDESPALLLEHSAQCELETRALIGVRRLDQATGRAVVELIESLADLRKSSVRKKLPFSR